MSRLSTLKAHATLFQDEKKGESLVLDALTLAQA
jgi:hypothetical protein